MSKQSFEDESDKSACDHKGCCFFDSSAEMNCTSNYRLCEFIGLKTKDSQAEKIKELELLLNKRIVFQRLKVARENVEKLESQNKMLRECAEFYADYSNWFDEKEPFLYDSIIDDMSVPECLCDDRGGKRARKALAQIKEQTK